MDHWFDGLTRKVGRKPLSRRSMFSWTAKLGLAVAGTSLAGHLTSPPLAKANSLLRTGTASSADAVPSLPAGAQPRMNSAASASGCQVEDTYGVYQSVATTAVDGTTPLTLTHRFLAEVGSGATSAVLTIVPGVMKNATPRVEPVLRMVVSSHPNRVASADATFGPLYTGASRRTSSFFTDGRTLKGIVDGRAAEPAQLGSDPRSIRFTDGQPADAASPTPTPPATAPSPETPDGGGSPRSAARIQGTPQPGANERRATPAAPAGPAAASAAAMQRAVSNLMQQARSSLGTCAVTTSNPATTRCTHCQTSCRDAWLQCSVAAIQSSLAAGTLAPTAYLTSASATCDAHLQQCFTTCKSSGGCCPDYCNGDAGCCQSAWGCCPPSPTRSQQWSAAWPTCPRCGTPPWSFAQSTPPNRSVTPVR